jgi:hypothetical protein
MGATRAIARVAGQEIEIAHFQVELAQHMSMQTLETTLLTWLARETFRSCAMEFLWTLVCDWHPGGSKGTM